MRGEEYIRWGAEARRQVADLCAAVTEGRISEAEGVAEVEALQREAYGLHALAAAELVVLGEASRVGDARVKELKEQLARLREGPGRPGPGGG